MSEPPGDFDPIAEFARAYRAELAVGSTRARDPESLGQQISEAQTWAWASVGAINRGDRARAAEAVRRLLRDDESTMVAVEVLTGILLSGVPREALSSTARFPVSPDEDQRPAVRSAADLLTGVARSDGQLVTSVLRDLSGGHGADVLLVLARAAAARIEWFAGLDGDTVDAYYQVIRGLAD